MLQKTLEVKNNHSDDARIFIEIGESDIAVCAVDEDPLKMVSFQLFTYNQDDNLNDVMHALKNEVLFSAEDVQVQLIWQNRYATCVPEKYTPENKYLSELVNAPANSEAFKSVVRSVKVKYFVEQDKTNAVKQVFNVANSCHKFTTVINHNLQLNASRNNLVHIIFYQNSFLITVTIQGALQLMNIFSFLTETDVLYHLLNVCNQLNLNLDQTTFLIAGRINNDSVLYRLLYNYLPHIEADDISERFSEDTPEDYPAHFFSSYFLNIDYFNDENNIR